MALTLSSDQIVAGSPYKIKVTITWEGAAISEVKAVVVNTLDDGKAQVAVTAPIALSHVSFGPDDGPAPGSYVWSGVLPAAETMKLLATPTDPASKVAVLNPVLMLEVSGTDADGDELKPVLFSDPLEVGRNPLYVGP